MSQLSNIIPLQALGLTTTLNSKSASTLMQIFEGDRDHYGRCIVPQAVDALDVVDLIDKGYLKNAAYPYLASATNVVDITAQGKQLLKSLILSSPSKFDLKKTASKIDLKFQSWLQKAISGL